MRKSFLFFALLAGIAIMTGCQKEQDGITLKAVIDQETKAYIDQIGSINYPFWESNDPVIINGTTYRITPSGSNGTCGTISGVTFSAPYCAFFPASIVNPTSISTIGSESTSGSASIYLNTHQRYSEVYEGGPQKVDMPMAAFTQEGSTLVFKNLCSVISVEVKTNDARGDFYVKSISVTAGVPICGNYTATIGYGEDEQESKDGQEIEVSLVAAASADASNTTVTLHDVNYASMGHIVTNYPKTFFIIVPAFESPSVSITVETMDGRFFTKTVSNAHIARSTTAPITLDAQNFPDEFSNAKAYLIPGEDFNKLLRNITPDGYPTYSEYPSFNAIQFDHVDNLPSPRVGKKLSTNDSPNEIWGYVVDNTLKVITTAKTVYANASCRKMFQDLTNVSNIKLANSVNFNTSEVTDMSWMFAGCDGIGSMLFGTEHFNTSNVTTMAHMFDGCTTLGLGGLALRSFDTHGLNADGMVAMFKNCNSMQSLDLSSFTTEQITDMTELFYGCGHMSNLDIRHFTIGEITKTDMCNGLQNQNQYGTVVITCTQDVADKLRVGTGLNPNIIDWHIVPEQ